MFRCMLSVLILGSLVKISFGLVLKARPVQSLTSDARGNGISFLNIRDRLVVIMHFY